jgi:two-component system invasion response regulator UvrY
VTRILLVDDHEIARRGLEQALAFNLPGATFGQAGSTEEALACLGAEHWDLAVVDLNMPGRDGLELLGEVRRLWPALPVLVVSAFAEEEFAFRCIRLGARGYVNKTSGAAEILTAVKRVLAGGKYITATLADRLATALGGGLARESYEALSARELQVLRMVAVGRSLKEIAGELHLSERTVATYRARIAEKLGLTSAVEITRFAIQNKLVE